jgi:outer membrane protein OmpA-like peptidoglycan-associated protein
MMMKTTGSLIIVKCAAVIVCGCASTTPNELLNARLAYQHASAGPAAQLVPADLHTANDALAKAENAFSEDGRSYHSRDLAYVAQRKAEMAEVLGSIAAEQKNKVGSDKAYLETQGNLLQAKNEDLTATRAALAVSEQSGQATAKQLSAEQTARLAAEQNTAEALLASPNRGVVVEGFTDSQGADQYNLDLSQRRADAVRQYIVQRGYPSDRVQAHGIGEERPVADNATAEGRANNRRVEIILERKNRM